MWLRQWVGESRGTAEQVKRRGGAKPEGGDNNVNKRAPLRALYSRPVECLLGLWASRRECPPTHHRTVCRRGMATSTGRGRAWGRSRTGA